MINTGDKVYISKLHNNYAAEGTVKDICTEIKALQKYFSEDHPFYMTYSSWINNNKSIYVVDLENKLGQAGFLATELTQSN